MMKYGAVPLLAVSIMLVAPMEGSIGAALAQDAAAGRVKASAQCAVCHGTNGMSQHPEAPNLAGQVEMYVMKSLEEFRSGTRNNEMMTVVAKDLSDADIANLAAWYASIEVTVQPPQ